MIASRLGLAIVAAIALGLALIVALGGGRAPTVVDRSLAPGFDADRVTELRWTRPDQPAIRVTREAERWVLASGGDADPRTVADVLAALRGARWHRRADAARAGKVTETLTIVGDAGERTLGIGEPLAGTDQVWLQAGADALLVDAWVARALDPDPLALHTTIIFPAIADAVSVTAGELGAHATPVVLEGAPLRVVDRAQHTSVWPDPALVTALDDALRALVLVALPGPCKPSGELTAIRTASATGREVDVFVGACDDRPDLVGVAGAKGTSLGFATKASWDAVARALAALRRPAAELVDRRPTPVPPAKLVLADGAVLDLTGAPQLAIGTARFDADPTAATELLAALAAPATVVALPEVPPTGTIVVTDRRGLAVSLELYPAETVARRDEPVALRLAPGAWAVLVRPGSAYRTRSLWREEPTTISAIAIDGIAWQRGPIVGEWQRAGAPARPAPAIEAWAALLAAPIATTDAPRHDFAVIHRIVLTISAPGTPATHILELGAAGATGCPARADGREIVLPRSICTPP